jgi:hypothetical protein
MKKRTQSIYKKNIVNEQTASTVAPSYISLKDFTGIKSGMFLLNLAVRYPFENHHQWILSVI